MHGSKGENKGGSERSGIKREGRMEEIGSAQELREELHHVGELARDAAYEQFNELRSRGAEKARQLEDRIVDQPLKSVAVAAGIGFVLGLMWMRR
jgi:ElaB/YqjD/DUF883 family membrane-anchored ribosome-binding protein